MYIDSIPVLAPHIILRKTSLGSNLISITNLTTKAFNQNETFILSQCNGMQKIKDIYQLFCNVYKKDIEINLLISFINSLEEKGYLIEFFDKTILNELSYLNNIKNFITDKINLSVNGIYSISIKIIDDCPLHCIYCSQCAPHQTYPKHFIDYKQIIQLLKDAFDYGARCVFLTGGEPLLYPDIESIIQYSRRIGYQKIMISTKATLIDNEKANNLYCSGLNEIQVSIDSIDKTIYEELVGVKDCYSKMLRGLYALVSSGLKINIKSVITNYNISSIPNLIYKLVNYGIDQFNFEVVVPCGRGDMELLPSNNELKKLKVQLDDIKNKYKIEVNLIYAKKGNIASCSGLYNTIHILTNGDVILCDKADFIKENLIMGNIYKDKLNEIWNSSKYMNLRYSRINNNICSECSEKHTCGGGCIVNSYLLNHSLDNPDPICNKFQNLDDYSYPYQI